MQKTEKLGLNLFEGSDPVLAESFNENTNILEEFCGRVPLIVTGSYSGDDSDTKTLTFDHKPALIIIGYSDAQTIICIHGWPYAVGCGTTGFSSEVFVTWDDETNSVTVTRANSHYHTYYYTAFLTTE